jgi:hypothetical protein
MVVVSRDGTGSDVNFLNYAAAAVVGCLGGGKETHLVFAMMKYRKDCGKPEVDLDFEGPKVQLILIKRRIRDEI